MPTPQGQNLINLSQQIINRIMGIQSDIDALEIQIAAIKAKVDTLQNADLSPVNNSLSNITSELAGAIFTLGLVYSTTNDVLGNIPPINAGVNTMLDKATAVLAAADVIIGILNTFQIQTIKNNTDTILELSQSIKVTGEATQSQASQTLFKLTNVEGDVDFIKDYLPGIDIKAGNAATRSQDALTILQGFEPVISNLPGAINQIGANINQLDGNITTQFTSAFNQIATLTQITGGIGQGVEANGAKLDVVNGTVNQIDTKAGNILELINSNLPIDLSAILGGQEAIKADTEEIKGLIDDIEFDTVPITRSIQEAQEALSDEITRAKNSIEAGIDELKPDLESIKADTSLIPQIPTQVKDELQPDFENIFENLPEIETTTTRITACNIEGFIDVPSNILKFKKQSAGNLLRPVLSALDFLVEQACPGLDDDENLIDYLPRIELRTSQRFNGLNEAGGVQLTSVQVPTLVIKNRDTGLDETLEGFNDLLFEELANVNPARVWRYLPRIITKESNVDGEPKALPLLEIRDVQDDQIKNMEVFNDELFEELNRIKQTIDVTEYEEDTEVLGVDIEYPGDVVALPERASVLLIEITEKPVGLGRRFGGDEQSDKFNFGFYAFIKGEYTSNEFPIERMQQVAVIPEELNPDSARIYLIPGCKATVSAIIKNPVVDNQNNGD